MNDFLVCLASSLACLRLLELAGSVHQQHVLISLPHQMIYFTTLRPHSTSTSPTLCSAPRSPGSSCLRTQHGHRNPICLGERLRRVIPHHQIGVVGHQGPEDETRPASTEMQDVQILSSWPGNTFNKREVTEAANFELADCWDEGEPLGGSQEWPVCVAQNLRFHGMT